MARSRRDAVEALEGVIRPMEQTLGCITSGRFAVLGKFDARAGQTSTVVLNRGEPSPLRRPDRRPLFLSVGSRFRLVEAEDERGSLHVETVEYWYAIDATTEPGGELLSFHWTPEVSGDEGIAEPHLHLKPRMIHPDAPLPRRTFGKLHIPTGRVSIESVVRFAIRELDVAPRRPDWRAVVDRNEDTSLQHRARR